MPENKKDNKPELFLTWDDEPSESAMEKMNGGCTSVCARCDGTGLYEGEPCYSCGGSGWRR